MDLTENGIRIYADELAEIVHPNGITAWEAGTLAAKAAELGLGEVQEGWEGITPDETGQIMRASVRRLIAAYKEHLDRKTFITPAEVENAARALEAVQDDDFAVPASIAIIVANPDLLPGLSR